MPRTVTALVTHGRTPVAVLGPFPVDVPWWAETGPILDHVEEVLGVPAVVLRLVRVEGSDGARDGHVTYHVEALEPVPDAAGSDLDPAFGLALADHPLRMPWARASGVRELLAWAAGHVEITGRPVQRKTWNLSGLFRLPTADGPVWLKAIPGFAAAEPAAIAALAGVDPGLVPTVLAGAPGCLLLADIDGVDCWDASVETAADVLRRLAAAQSAVAGPSGWLPAELSDRTPGKLVDAVRALLAGPVGAELDAKELDAALALLPRWEQLADCGLPDTVVHGDFHPGNWRRGDGPPVVLDFADAHLGSPVLDALRAIGWLPEDRRRPVAEAWVQAWSAAVPDARPADALRIAEPLAHLAYAVRYQEFLDNIEPSEQIYHLGDPAAAIRQAIATAEDPCRGWSMSASS